MLLLGCILGLLFVRNVGQVTPDHTSQKTVCSFRREQNWEILELFYLFTAVTSWGRWSERTGRGRHLHVACESWCSNHLDRRPSPWPPWPCWVTLVVCWLAQIDNVLLSTFSGTSVHTCFPSLSYFLPSSLALVPFCYFAFRSFCFTPFYSLSFCLQLLLSINFYFFLSFILFLFSFSFFLHSTLHFLNSSSFRLPLSLFLSLLLFFILISFLSFLSAWLLFPPSFFCLPSVSFIFSLPHCHSLIASLLGPLSATEDIQSLAVLNLGF